MRFCIKHDDVWELVNEYIDGVNKDKEHGKISEIPFDILKMGHLTWVGYHGDNPILIRKPIIHPDWNVTNQSELACVTDARFFEREDAKHESAYLAVAAIIASIVKYYQSGLLVIEDDDNVDVHLGKIVNNGEETYEEGFDWNLTIAYQDECE
jgi:hypothetical protein